MAKLDRPVLLAALLALTGGLATADPAAPPDECRFEAEAPTGASATMACFAALDTNGDGELSKLEAMALPRLEGSFQELDADASGALSPEELQAALHTPSQRGGGKGV
jgi:hypothetical protein